MIEFLSGFVVGSYLTGIPFTLLSWLATDHPFHEPDYPRGEALTAGIMWPLLAAMFLGVVMGEI